MAIETGVLEITQENSVQLTEGAILDQNELVELRAYYEETTSGIAVPAYTEPENSTHFIGNPNPEIWDGGSGSSHSCLAMTFDMIGICEDNYQHIASYYNSMLIAQMTNAELNPYIATAAYWVNLVREGGRLGL